MSISDFTNLIPAQQILLVTAASPSAGGGLFAWDGKDTIRIDGLSCNSVLMIKNRLYRQLYMPAETEDGTELLVYDEKGIERYHRIDQIVDSHELTWDGEYFVSPSTMTNEVIWFTPYGEIIRKWMPPGSHNAARINDAWHVNNVFFKDNQIFITAFGKFAGHREWHEHRHDGSGLVYNLTTGEDVITGLNCPHNPIFLDDTWIVCNSANSELLQIDPVTKQTIRKLALKGWTRGMAITDKFLFVGESENRKNPDDDSHSGVAIIRRSDWKIIGRIPIPEGEIGGLSLAPRSMLKALKNGFNTNPLRKAETARFHLFEQTGLDKFALTSDPLTAEDLSVSITAKIPDKLLVNNRQFYECEIRNDGKDFFISAPPNPVHIAYKWIDEKSRTLVITEGLRTSLPKLIAPQESIKCYFKLETPHKTGQYILRLTLVQELVAWFDHINEKNYSEFPVSVVADLTNEGETVA